MNRPDGPASHRVTPFDAEVLAALHRLCFPDDPWDATTFGTLLASPVVFGVLLSLPVPATDGPGTVLEPAGFALARVVAGEAEILTLGVRPEARRRGLGRRLLDAALAQAARRGADQVFLEVAEDNAEARALYSRAGFTVVGRRPGYYRRRDATVAALVLARPVST